jgi:hypothetical protein
VGGKDRDGFLAKRPATPSLREGIHSPNRRKIPPFLSVSFDVSRPLTHHLTGEAIDSEVFDPPLGRPVIPPLLKQPLVALTSSFGFTLPCLLS